MAVTVKLNPPVAVGVPERTPLLLRVRPVGTVPVVVAKVNGPVPPEAVTSRTTSIALATLPMGWNCAPGPLGLTGSPISRQRIRADVAADHNPAL